MLRTYNTAHLFYHYRGFEKLVYPLINYNIT